MRGILQTGQIRFLYSKGFVDCTHNNVMSCSWRSIFLYLLYPEHFLKVRGKDDPDSRVEILNILGKRLTHDNTSMRF
jgi:hypothetical protein